MLVSRRVALVGAAFVALSASGCSGSPPMDEGEVNRVVGEVDGVASVDLRVESNGGSSGWFLKGEIGLPDDREEALTVYDNCLRAIAGVDVSTQAPVELYVYGVSSSGELEPDDVGAPLDTNRLKEHY